MFIFEFDEINKKSDKFIKYNRIGSNVTNYQIDRLCSIQRVLDISKNSQLTILDTRTLFNE